MTSVTLQPGLDEDAAAFRAPLRGPGAVLLVLLPAAMVTLVCFIPSGLVACAHGVAACGHALGGRDEAWLESRRAAARWCWLTVGFGLLRDAPVLAAWAGLTLV